MNLPVPNYAYPSEMGMPNPPVRENLMIDLGSFGPKKPGPTGHRGAGQRPVVRPVVTQRPSSYCMNKTCNLSTPGGCCPGYGCKAATGLAVGMGTCQRVSGGPR